MIKVKAIEVGFDGFKRIREGQEFEIESEKQFSKKWMERLEPKKEEEVKEEKAAPKSKAKKILDVI